MSLKRKKIVVNKEILFNKTGQLLLKKRFLFQLINKFYRCISSE